MVHVQAVRGVDKKLLCHAIGRDVSEPAVAVNLLQLHVSGLPPQKQKCRVTSAHAHMFFLAPMGLQFIWRAQVLSPHVESLGCQVGPMTSLVCFGPRGSKIPLHRFESSSDFRNQEKRNSQNMCMLESGSPQIVLRRNYTTTLGGNSKRIREPPFPPRILARSIFQIPGSGSHSTGFYLILYNWFWRPQDPFAKTVANQDPTSRKTYPKFAAWTNFRKIQ